MCIAYRSRLGHKKGGKGTLINLFGAGESNDTYVCEIAPGKSLKPERHMFEEMIFILQGRGATSVWVEGSPKHVFEWQEGSLFAAPLNIWHELHNGQGDQPARFLAVTSAPLVMNLYHNFDFIFNNSFIFEDRYQPVADYFSPKGKLVQGLISRVWESNFIPDVNQFKLPIARSAVAGERGSRLSFLKTPWQLIPRVLLWTSTKKLIVMDPARTF